MSSSSSSPTIHLLDKANYSNHRLVTLTNDHLLPLAPSSIRFQPKILGLTTNNLSYARIGHLMGWYDVYPLPPTTPAPYHDSATHGRVAAWGYASILESRIPGIHVGQTVYGFLPISTGREDTSIVSISGRFTIGTVFALPWRSSSGFFDTVVLNSFAQAVASEIEGSGTRRVVLLDFGASLGANEAWRSALSSLSLNISFTLITVGSEVAPQNPEKAAKRLAAMSSLNIVNASLLKEKGIEVGGETYFTEFYGAWDVFRTKIVGVSLQWGDGLEAWEEGWEALVKDEVRADTGLVYRT